MNMALSERGWSAPVLALGLVLLGFGAGTARAALILQTDTSWKGTTSAPLSGWNTNLAYDDSGWANASIVTSGSSTWPVSVDGNQLNPIWPNPSQAGGSGWFRKSFELTGTLLAPQLDFIFDDDGELYLNGHLIFDDKSVFSGPALINFDPTPYLTVGTNLLAFHAYDTLGFFHFGAGRLDAAGITAAVPEPASLVILGVGLLALGVARCRRYSGVATR